MQLNASRIKVLQAQDDVVSSMKDDASKDLLNVSRDHQVYKKLLKDLIVQVSDTARSLKFLNISESCIIRSDVWNFLF